MLTMDIDYFQLIMSQIIIIGASLTLYFCFFLNSLTKNLTRTGVFGARLIKEQSNFDKALGLFTENHWKTNITLIICINHLRI